MSADWVERDAARVWHGFTQMAAYADGAPVLEELAPLLERARHLGERPWRVSTSALRIHPTRHAPGVRVERRAAAG